MSSKLRNLGPDQVAFWCPGCELLHAIKVEGLGAWRWNGDAEAPTFNPSIRTFTNYDEQHGRLPDGQTRTLCHSFVTDGHIQFLGDSVHALAGQTVPLPDLPPHLRD